ncbi:MAG TPA: hypothetical protein PKC43_06715 [Phycisphaerales bacterium]|nr:hypothetical protein [Phycisphaerales bacterium]HMP37124.1 hypothetical protein [Phycisphaerales bacterium]
MTPSAAALAIIIGVMPNATSGAAPVRPAPPTAGALAERPSIAPEQWDAEIDELVAILEHRHVDPFAVTSREEFRTAADGLKQRLPGLTSEQVLIEIAKLTALLGDPGTSAALDQFRLRFRTLPVRLAFIEEGVVVSFATSEHADLLGAEVIAIGDVPIAQLAKDLLAVVAVDNRWGARQRLANLAHFVELLAANGAAPAEGPVSITAMPRGAPRSERDGADAGDAPAAGAPVTVELIPLPPRVAPELRSIVDLTPRDRQPISWRTGRGNFWFERIPDREAILFKYDRCIDNPGAPFARTAADAIAEMKEMAEPRIVIDLRQNGGGDSRIIEPLIAALESDERFRRPGSVVVLIGPRTQGSGAMNALSLRARAGALLVGEPTGQRPNHLGEMRTANLPNTGLVVSYSTRRFRQVEGDPEAVMPDEVVLLKIEDVLGGRDAALERALDPALVPG